MITIIYVGFCVVSSFWVYHSGFSNNRTPLDMYFAQQLLGTHVTAGGVQKTEVKLVLGTSLLMILSVME